MPHCTDPNIPRYLERYADLRAKHAARSFVSSHRGLYEQAVVVPLFDEPPNCLAHVFQHLIDTPTLVVAVVNCPDDAKADARERTLALLTHAAAATPLDVLLIDCATTPLPRVSAVGEARKIGTDAALLLYSQKEISSPWLYQTDADAVLPPDYFEQSLPSSGAVVFEHRHTSANPRLATAAKLYDAHMAYYVAGLRAAGSPYAYPTLGSTIAVHAGSYAAVRGFPKRNAAEDFYLLNKVAKIHAVHHIPDVVITLAARSSTRVPFGTGPALREICKGLADDPSGSFYLSYHPQSFGLLRDALTCLAQLSNQPEATDRLLPTSAADVMGILDTLGFGRVRDNILGQYASASQRRRALFEWFDAGKTLRFIHLARERHPDQPLLRTLDTLPTWIASHLNTAR